MGLDLTDDKFCRSKTYKSEIDFYENSFNNYSLTKMKDEPGLDEFIYTPKGNILALLTHCLVEKVEDQTNQISNTKNKEKRSSNEDYEFEMEIDDNMIELDEFAVFNKLAQSKLSQSRTKAIRKRSYSKEDVKIGQNVIISTGATSSEFVISEQSDTENVK